MKKFLFICSVILLYYITYFIIWFLDKIIECYSILGLIGSLLYTAAAFGFWLAFCAMLMVSIKLFTDIIKK